MLGLRLAVALVPGEARVDCRVVWRLPTRLVVTLDGPPPPAELVAVAARLRVALSSPAVPPSVA